MYIDSPTWYLNKSCPCCDEYEDGELEIVCCTECSKVYAVCNLTKTIFLDPLNITLDRSIEGKGNFLCPNCKSEKGFRPAKDYELWAIGLKPEVYH